MEDTVLTYSRKGALNSNVSLDDSVNKVSRLGKEYSDHFSCLSDLKKQMTMHIRPKTHGCTFCGSEFSCASKLAVHTRVHTGEKPFKCKFCDSAFSRSSSLVEHIRSHTGERPFECSFCVSAFSSKVALNRHVRIHTGERPYRCSLCEAAFSQSNNLKVHIRSHTDERPFKCEYCVFAFTQRCDLNSHLLTHTGEKPFTCSLCDTSFAKMSALRRHVKIHTGQKPHICDFCTSAFATLSSMRRHVQKNCFYARNVILDGRNEQERVKAHLERQNVNDFYDPTVPGQEMKVSRVRCSNDGYRESIYGISTVSHVRKPEVFEKQMSRGNCLKWDSHNESNYSTSESLTDPPKQIVRDEKRTTLEGNPKDTPTQLLEKNVDKSLNPILIKNEVEVGTEDEEIVHPYCMVGLWNGETM